jgi:NAD(P)-dependent dehydrogenase (short-subunit alcohol dehydrogenase family)
VTAGSSDAGIRIRTALVTGGTGGTGRAIAAQLASDGLDVALAQVGSVDLADATVKEIAGHGRRGAAFAADIADADATSAVFDAVEDRFGHLDVVVHTAGINRRRRRPTNSIPGRMPSSPTRLVRGAGRRIVGPATLAGNRHRARLAAPPASLGAGSGGTTVAGTRGSQVWLTVKATGVEVCPPADRQPA